MYNLAQLFTTSLHCLWVYDYFLTLEDEVQCTSGSFQRFHILTVGQIKYAWSGRKSWGEFNPPFLNIERLMWLPDSVFTVHHRTVS